MTTTPDDKRAFMQGAARSTFALALAGGTALGAAAQSSVVVFGTLDESLRSLATGSAQPGPG